MLPAGLDFAVISLSLAALITSIFIFIVAFRKSKSVSDFFFILFSISILFWIASELGLSFQPVSAGLLYLGQQMEIQKKYPMNLAQNK